MSKFINYMVIVVFIVLATNIIMIWLSIKREKWVYSSRNNIFNVVLVDQRNNKLSNRRYNKFKKEG